MTVPAWLVRGLLAALLVFGSEILLWTNPTGRTLSDWLILVAGYLALSAVLLDLAARYRVRDVFGLLALAGVYGLANSLLLNPQTAMADMPRTLVTRVMGAHTLIGLFMLTLFLALAGGSIRRAVYVAIGVAGLGWGVWVRWLATFTDIVSADIALGTMLVYGVGGLAVTVILLQLSASQRRQFSLQLGVVEWLIAAAVFGANFVTRIGTIEPLWPIIIVILLAFCALLVWFQKREKGSMLLDNRLPLHPTEFSQIAVAAFLFLGAGLIGYNLPLSADGEQLALLIGLFTAFGLVWLPTVSLVLGVRAYRKLTRQQHW